MTCAPPTQHHVLRVTVLDANGHATDRLVLARTGEHGSDRPIRYATLPNNAGAAPLLSLTIPDLDGARPLSRFVDNAGDMQLAIETWTTGMPTELAEQRLRPPTGRPLLYVLFPRVEHGRAAHMRRDHELTLNGQLRDHAAFTPYRYGSADLPTLADGEVMHLGFVDRGPVPLTT